jgi:mRNA interferase MazF
MPNTTTYDYGDVVLVPFPFAEYNTLAKNRPAVVISSNSYNAEAVVIGSNEYLDLMIVIGVSSVEGIVGGVTLKKWKEAGLKHPSAIKPMITTVSPSKVSQRLGKLTITDLNQLKRMLLKVLNLTPSST